MLTDNESPEKRLAPPRYLARITIYYGGAFPEEQLSEYSINISTGGVFIESSKILPEDTVLTIRFKLPNTLGPIYTHARVAWVNEPHALKKPSLPPGMGLQFLTLTVEDMHTIRTFIDSGDFETVW